MKLLAAVFGLLPGVLSAAVLSGDRPSRAAEADRAAGPAFRGEDCRQCHAALRDHRPAPLAPEMRPADAGFYDVIVVGGGLSGLTAAHYLKDYKVLVLDKEAKAGGKMRRESFDGHPYAVAGVYMGKPEGRVQELFKALGLKIQQVVLPEHVLDQGGKRIPQWIAGDPARLPYPPAVQARFKSFQAKLREAVSSNKLAIPVEDSDRKTLEEYDQYTYFQWLDNNFGPEVSALGDLYTRDVFGVGSEQVSAAAGLEFMSSEMEPSYTWEGGLGTASEALAAELGPRISTGAFVWKVSQGFEGAVVDFQDSKRDFRARSRAVVMAVPSLVARRIVAGLTDEKREAMGAVRYSAYAVVPLRMKRVLFNGAFVLWTPGRWFTDVTLPVPSPETLRGAAEEALVPYIPLGESEGRRFLLNASDDEISRKVLADLDTVFAGGASEVAQARVIRWGHAMPIPYPGYLTKVRPALAKAEGRIFFAGVDTQLASFEGAVHSGVKAADEARQFLKGQARAR